jgi:hypothetical protein
VNPGSNDASRAPHKNEGTRPGGGCIAGVAVTVCFNFIAQNTAGIDTKWVGVAEDSWAFPARVTAK